MKHSYTKFRQDIMIVYVTHLQHTKIWWWLRYPYTWWRTLQKNVRISVHGWHDRQAVIVTPITEISCLLYKKHAQILKGIICYSTYSCCIKKLLGEIFYSHSHYFRIYTTVQCSAGKKLHYPTASNLIVKKAVLLRKFNKQVYGLQYSPILLCNKSS